MVRYSGNIFRPPSEADSLLLQVTFGCSHNKCAFCAMYKDRRFAVRDMKEIREDILSANEYDSGVTRVFLCDGDAMSLPTAQLSEILDLLSANLPDLRRVGIYANARDILAKTPEELELLRSKKLGIAYLGLESGDDEILKSMKKDATAGELIAAVVKAQKAGIKMSVMALLGLGGTARWEEHARKTADAINKMNPRFISFLSVMIVPGTPLEIMQRKGDFVLPDATGLIRELRLIVENLELENSILRSNHASNYLPLGGTMPKDKQRLLAEIDSCLDGVRPIKPEFLRGL